MLHCWLSVESIETFALCSSSSKQNSCSSLSTVCCWKPSGTAAKRSSLQASFEQSFGQVERDKEDAACSFSLTFDSISREKLREKEGPNLCRERKSLLATQTHFGWRQIFSGPKINGRRELSATRLKRLARKCQGQRNFDELEAIYLCAKPKLARARAQRLEFSPHFQAQAQAQASE